MLTRPLKFEEAWGEAAPQLRALLRRRGVDVDLAEDAVQETATRAIERDVPFESVDHLLRWANVVAWRFVLNQWRGQRWLAPGPVPERPTVDAVDDQALDRYTLAEVAATMSKLSKSDQAALLDPLVPAMSRTDATRFYVRRHRARARLAAMLHGLAGALAWLIHRTTRPRTRAAVVAIAGPIVMVAMLSLPHWGADGGQTPLREDPANPSGAQRASSSVPAPPTTPSAPRGSGSGTTEPDRRRGAIPIPIIGVPVNDDLGVRTRRPEPDDHLFCWQTIIAGVLCVDTPEPVKELVD